MDSADAVVLRALHAWRSRGEPALLATVLNTWGSSPRPIGSLLALRPGQEIVGSVSGGCIEDDLFQRFAGPLSLSDNQVLRYGVSADEAHRFGIPCGGTIELLIETNPCAELLSQLLQHNEQGLTMRRELHLSTGRVQLFTAQKHLPLLFKDGGLGMSFGPRWRMLLIGAGLLAQYLTQMACFNGFAVTVCDPRTEYTQGWDSSQARLDRSMPDDAVLSFQPDANTCIVTLSHDPKLDDLALMEALYSPAFYVGAIGSRRNTEARRARLMEHFEMPEAALNKLHGPAGMYIDSKTPAEIAVSIMAQIIAVKNGVTEQLSVRSGKDQAGQTLQAI